MPTVQDALAISAAGWEIGPLRGKVPVTENGCKDFTRDPEQINAWWPTGAAWNIGGHHPGIVTIDIDPRNGGTVEKLEELIGGPVPTTLGTMSGRMDGGQHFHFRHPGVSLTAAPLRDTGIDLKTPAGYVVLPPSIHPATGQPYQWVDAPVASMPDGLVKLLLRQPPRARPRTVTPHQGSSGLARFVSNLTEGQRNSGLFWAACEAARGGKLDALEGPLLEAALTIGLDEREARAVIQSARRTERV